MTDAFQEIPHEVAAILDAYPDPAIILGLDYRILAANAQYKRVYGDSSPIRGRHCYEVSHGIKVPCEMAGESCPVLDVLHSGEAKRVLHVHHTQGQWTRRLRYDFPGNIRELRNIIERALLLTDGDLITRNELPNNLLKSVSKESKPSPLRFDEIIPLEEMEQRYLLTADKQHEGDRKSLATKLGISESTLYRKLKELYESDSEKNGVGNACKDMRLNVNLYDLTVQTVSDVLPPSSSEVSSQSPLLCERPV